MTERSPGRVRNRDAMRQRRRDVAPGAAWIRGRWVYFDRCDRTGLWLGGRLVLSPEEAQQTTAVGE